MYLKKWVDEKKKLLFIFQTIQQFRETVGDALRTIKSMTYYFVYKVVVLGLYLLFHLLLQLFQTSIFNHKYYTTKFHNKMEGAILVFLEGILIYALKEIVVKFSTKLIIDDFSVQKSIKFHFDIS